ncbi:MAG: MFS transporter [Dehalococcoidia bacterium]|nr:MFS transporter [Dehalococcoidia bacterium]
MTTARDSFGAPRRAYLIFAIMSGSMLIASIDGSIVSVALPTLETELHTSLAWIGWMLTAYALAGVSVMPLAGKLSDEWGRKRVFLISVALFTGGSIASGLAPNIYVLMVCRTIQALGGGAFFPSAVGIISETFGARRQTFVGLFSSVVPLGSIIGPNIGGVIVDHLSWRWLFFVNAPTGVVLLLAGLRYLPKNSPRGGRRGLDLRGTGLFAGGVGSILFAMASAANSGGYMRRPEVWVLLALGVALLVIFWRHESRTETPLMDLQLLKWRPLLAANVYNFVYGACVFGFFQFIPYYAQVGYGMSASQSGAILSPRSVTMALFAVASSFLIVRTGYRRPMLAASLILSLSLLLLGLGLRHISIFGQGIPISVWLGLVVGFAGAGFGVGSPASTNATLDLVPGKAAAITGIRGMFRQTGGAIGTAVVVLALSLTPDKREGMQHIFLALSAGLLLTIPLIFMIPDTAWERRRPKQAQG